MVGSSPGNFLTSRMPKKPSNTFYTITKLLNWTVFSALYDSEEKFTNFLLLKVDIYLKKVFVRDHREFHSLFNLHRFSKGILVWRSQMTGHMAVTDGKTYLLLLYKLKLKASRQEYMYIEDTEKRSCTHLFLFFFFFFFFIIFFNLFFIYLFFYNLSLKLR